MRSSFPDDGSQSESLSVPIPVTSGLPDHHSGGTVPAISKLRVALPAAISKMLKEVKSPPTRFWPPGRYDSTYDNPGIVLVGLPVAASQIVFLAPVGDAVAGCFPSGAQVTAAP